MHADRGYGARSYGADEIDLVAGLLRRRSTGATFCRSRSSRAGERSSCGSRRRRTASGRVINLAVDFELPGAVAQLEERLRWHAEARGSSPLSSTPAPPEALQVGANQFRNHFGYYLEQAGEGHEVLVSRRGRPYVRLTPVEPPLELVAA